jgi:hypothetical protein
MAPALEPALAEVLRTLIADVRPILAGNFVGAYLQGSFAVGDADDSSDVDFLFVVNDDVPECQVAALQAVHVRVYELASNWARHLEGSYFPRAWLADPSTAGRPLLYVDNGSRVLERSAHDNTLVVRWVLWHHGVRLEGPEPRALLGPVPPGALRAEVAATMRHWAAIVAANPAEVDNGWYQPFAVVNYCRMLHTLATGRIVSKPTGARWAQQELDPRWAGLIERGLEQHAGQWGRVAQRADPDDLASTYEFVRYAVAQIDRLLRQSPEVA